MRFIASCLLALSISPALFAEETTEDWQARFQSTYIWQQSSGFPASYSGQNSLSDQRETGYTFTATAFLGARPWHGGEVYMNVEVGQGNPLSGLTGRAEVMDAVASHDHVSVRSGHKIGKSTAACALALWWTGLRRAPS